MTPLFSWQNPQSGSRTQRHALWLEYSRRNRRDYGAAFALRMARAHCPA